MSFEASLKVGDGAYTYYPVSEIEGAAQLPYSLTVLLENALRCGRTPEEAQAMAERIVTAGLAGQTGEEVEFSPARVLFQDFTGVPVFVDFAVMREACADLGGDPKKINPQVPCDLVIDHSVIADVAGCDGCMEENMKLEFKRNGERYDFLKWAQESFENVRIVPPGQGICHQLNIEKFASVVMESPAGLTGADGTPVVYFDTLVGTDSHTPTANGIGVLGWGVGGIEAEAAALGQPITTLADVRTNAARARCGGLLCGMLRPRCGGAFRHPARLHLEHDPGVRLHLHAVPGGRPHPGLPAPHGPQRRAGGSG